MKKYYILWLVFFAIPVFGQDAVRETVDDYLKVTEEKNFEAILDRMYPKFFELAPRELMLNVLQQSFSDPSFKIEIKDSKILDISEQKIVDTVTYYKVGYSFLMEMQYVGEESDGDSETLQLIKDTFESMYGKENVSFDREKKKFSMKAKKEMLVLRAGADKDWKVLGIEDNLKSLLLKIIPKEIVDEF